VPFRENGVQGKKKDLMGDIRSWDVEPDGNTEQTPILSGKARKKNGEREKLLLLVGLGKVLNIKTFEETELWAGNSTTRRKKGGLGAQARCGSLNGKAGTGRSKPIDTGEQGECEGSTNGQKVGKPVWKKPAVENRQTSKEKTNSNTIKEEKGVNFCAAIFNRQGQAEKETHVEPRMNKGYQEGKDLQKTMGVSSDLPPFST